MIWFVLVFLASIGSNHGVHRDSDKHHEGTERLADVVGGSRLEDKSLEAIATFLLVLRHPTAWRCMTGLDQRSRTRQAVSKLEIEHAVLLPAGLRLHSRSPAPRSELSSRLGDATDPKESLTQANLKPAESLVNELFPDGDAFAARERIGRIAQLGPDLIYRSNEVDGALTYGEFDLGFFASLVDRAFETRSGGASGATFVDVGSGCGRLVFAAARLWPSLAYCAGVERVPELHQLAIDALAKADLSQPQCSFSCGDAAAALSEGGIFAKADVLFAYCSTWASDGLALTDFSATCGTYLRVGARVITIDKKLASKDGCWNFRLLDSFDGANRGTFGSTGYIWEVVQSLRGLE